MDTAEGIVAQIKETPGRIETSQRRHHQRKSITHLVHISLQPIPHRRGGDPFPCWGREKNSAGDDYTVKTELPVALWLWSLLLPRWSLLPKSMSMLMSLLALE